MRIRLNKKNCDSILNLIRRPFVKHTLSKGLFVCALIVSVSMSSMLLAEDEGKRPVLGAGKSDSSDGDTESGGKRSKDEKMKEAGVNVHTFGLGLGETFLMGNFDKHGDDAITADLLYTYSASHSFDLFADFHRSKHKKAQEKVILQGAAAGIKGKMYHFDAFSPFVVGGLGFYRPRVTRTVLGNYGESGAKTSFGFMLGGGLYLRLNKSVTVGMLALYHDPFDVKQDVGPKVSGAYFKLMLTASYAFWF
ncbi:MAG: hypothetical protein HQK50_13720 [Oligoflexia bacterium]|nr:hypothetical protein [Oligoflexia bacterium]